MVTSNCADKAYGLNQGEFETLAKCVEKERTVKAYTPSGSPISQYSSVSFTHSPKTCIGMNIAHFVSAVDSCAVDLVNVSRFARTVDDRADICKAKDETGERELVTDELKVDDCRFHAVPLQVRTQRSRDPC